MENVEKQIKISEIIGNNIEARIALLKRNDASDCMNTFIALRKYLEENIKDDGRFEITQRYEQNPNSNFGFAFSVFVSIGEKGEEGYPSNNFLFQVTEHPEWIKSETEKLEKFVDEQYIHKFIY